MVTETFEIKRETLHFGKKTDSIEHLIDDFEDKISKCDNRNLIDDAIEIDHDITFVRADLRLEDASAVAIFIDKLNGLNSRFDDLKLSFEKDCRCK